MDDIKIKLFGRFEILINGESIDNQILRSKKSCLLIQYLILNRDRSIPYAELFNVIWPHEESSNPESALKTMISRLRVTMSHFSPALAACIETAKGSYRWTENEAVDVDVIRFEFLSSLLNDGNELTEESRKQFRELFSLYRGDLLEGNSLESWIVVKNIHYHSLYLSCVHHHTELLYNAGDFENTASLCHDALRLCPSDERLRILLVNSLQKTGFQGETFRAVPSDADLSGQDDTLLIWNRIMQLSRSANEDLSRIRQELAPVNEERGAYVCGFDVFRELYRLQLRSARRNRMTGAFLVLLTVSPNDSEDTAFTEKKSAMKLLSQILREHLRQSDVICRYSDAQYLLLLPIKSFEDGHTVMERINRDFYAHFNRSSVILDTRTVPVSDLQ